MTWPNAGSLAATNGNNAFVGTGTLLLSALVGDALVYQNGTTFWASEISTITDNTHAATAENWPFSSGTIANGDWSILPCSPLRQTAATTNAQLATIIAQFTSILSLSAASNTATFDKAANTNSAGVYLTTGGSARGRIGTFGDDNLRLSVANGGGYTDVLIATYTTGLVTVVGDPTAALGIATKQYVDGSSNAKEVRAISTTNINISSPGTTIGGVTPAASERYGLFGQTTASQNGLYFYNTSTSAMTRCTDADAVNELQPGCLVMATEGTYASKVFMLVTAAPLVIGTTNLTFSRLDTLFNASPTFTGTITAPDGATWNSAGVLGLLRLGINQSSYIRTDTMVEISGYSGAAGAPKILLSDVTLSSSLAYPTDYGVTWYGNNSVNTQVQLGSVFGGWSSSNDASTGFGYIGLHSNYAGGATVSLDLVCVADHGIIMFSPNTSYTSNAPGAGILKVYGSIYSSGAFVGQNGSIDGEIIGATFAGSAHNGILLTDSTAHNGAAFVGLFSTTTNIGAILNNNNTGTTFSTTSDETLKKDWAIVSPDKVRALLGGLYVAEHAWVANENAPRAINFKAQQGHTVHPQAFTPGNELSDPAQKFRPWMRNLGEVEPLLVLGWQTHEQDIQTLKTQILELTKAAA